MVTVGQLAKKAQIPKAWIYAFRHTAMQSLEKNSFDCKQNVGGRGCAAADG